MSAQAGTGDLVKPASLPEARAVAELLKPITWFAPMWAYGCGVVSGGGSLSRHWPSILLGITLAGPLVCATSQAANDWFDRHVDAINEPGRPIPSGRIPGQWGLYIAIAWTLLSLAAAAVLGPVCLAAASLGLLLAWIYSAPPLRLKNNGWWGNAACGACYETLPWITGAAVMSAGTPDPRILIAAALYGIGAHGIMTLNDFKSVEGDTEMGIRSLPVMLGIKRAAVLACAVMAIPQGIMMVLLSIWGHALSAGLVAGVLFAQVVLMTKFLLKPRELAPWYNGTGTTLYVAGMMVVACALRP